MEELEDTGSDSETHLAKLALDSSRFGGSLRSFADLREEADTVPVASATSHGNILEESWPQRSRRTSKATGRASSGLRGLPLAVL